MDWMVWVFERTFVGAVLCLAAVYALGFFSGRAKERVDRKRAASREMV